MGLPELVERLTLLMCFDCLVWFVRTTGVSDRMTSAFNIRQRIGVHVLSLLEMHVGEALHDEATQVVHPAHEVLRLSRGADVLGERNHRRIVHHVSDGQLRELGESRE